MKPSWAALSELERFWLAYGQFLHTFAHVETGTAVALWFASGVTANVAKAVFSGVRIDAATSQIRRIYEANERELPASVSRAFVHLKDITTLRNSLVHYGAQFSDDWTGHTAKAPLPMPGTENKMPVSVSILLDAISDLHTISAALVGVGMESSAMPKKVQDRWVQTALTPWRYTPPPPDRARPQRQGSDPKRKPRREPSPE